MLFSFIKQIKTGDKGHHGLSFGLTLFDKGFFEPSAMGGHEGPHHNFVVIVSMIKKFGTGIKLDVFFTVVLTKKFVTSLLLHNYDVITCILADA